MKILLTILYLSFSLMAQANLDECFRDAKTNGSHTTPLSPVAECADLVKNHPEKREARTSDNKYHFYGLGEMLYLETEGKRELLAGDQTELINISKIKINELKKRFLILQDDSVSTYDLEFIGNVSPLRHFKSAMMSNAAGATLLDNEEMIAVFYSQGIKILNSDADSRFDVEDRRPKILNEIMGEASLLSQPVDLIFHSSKNKIYVLDSDRVLIFSSSVKRNEAPLSVVNVHDAKSLRLQGELLYIVKSDAQSVLVPLGD